MNVVVKELIVVVNVCCTKVEGKRCGVVVLTNAMFDVIVGKML